MTKTDYCIRISEKDAMVDMNNVGNTRLKPSDHGSLKRNILKGKVTYVVRVHLPLFCNTKVNYNL